MKKQFPSSSSYYFFLGDRIPLFSVQKGSKLLDFANSSKNVLAFLTLSDLEKLLI